MANLVERAVRTYIQIFNEPNATRRAELAEQCFAEDGRLVSRKREMRGRAALLAEASAVLGERPPKIRITSELDFGQTTFRFSSALETANGGTAEFHDCGEIDESGKIRLIVTFDGPLHPAQS